MLRAFWQDVRYATRLLAKNPGTTLVAVVALGLGLGVNASVFTGVKALLLEPFPFRDLDRIVTVWETLPKLRTQRAPLAPANYSDLKEQARSFERLAAYQPWEVNLTGAGDPERVQGFLVGSDFFAVLGMRPQLGRTLSPDEEREGRPVVVVSHGLWARRLGEDPRAVGRTLTFNGGQHTVVGVMPRDFDFPLGTEVWAPLRLAGEEQARRATHYLSALGRLKPEVSIEQARAELAAIAGRLERLHPLTNAGRGLLALRLVETINAVTNRFMLIVQATALLVLLLACANVANLQLARLGGRYREMALRAALGGSRWRITRQLLVENVLVALLGGVLGTFQAMWGVDLQRAAIPPQVLKWVPGLGRLDVDGRVLAFTLAITVLAGLLCGLAPALQICGQRSLAALNESLKEGGRTLGVGRRGQRLRGALVVSEVVIALVLLVGAGLMVRSFRRMAAMNVGFHPESLLTMRVALPAGRYGEGAPVAAFSDKLLHGVRTLPEVRAAGVEASLGRAENLRLEGRPEPAPGEPRPEVRPVSAGYFLAMGIPLVSGRAIEERDATHSPRVAVLSQSLARHYWPEVSPLDRRVQVGGRPSEWLSVVGVVGDVKDWFRGEPDPIVYVPFSQTPRRAMRLMIRTAGDPLRTAGGARAQVHAVDPDQPVYEVKSMEQALAEQTSGVRLSAFNMGLFAGLALLLAASGIYGVISYSVVQRTHEIGVRMALGARQGDVLRLVVGQAMKMALLGIGLGLPAALALACLMSSAVFGVVALEGAVFGGCALVLAGVALLSGWVPARRAARLEPMAALRYE